MWNILMNEAYKLLAHCNRHRPTAMQCFKDWSAPLLTLDEKASGVFVNINAF